MRPDREYQVPHQAVHRKQPTPPSPGLHRGHRVLTGRIFPHHLPPPQKKIIEHVFYGGCSQDLDISFNDLKLLPDRIGGLCNMLTLTASSNHLKCLPSTIGAASSLQSLYLQDNVRENFARLGGVVYRTFATVCSCFVNFPLRSASWGTSKCSA